MAYERAKKDLQKASQEITHLEESLYGKQAALDSVMEENEHLKAQLQAQVGRLTTALTE